MLAKGPPEGGGWDGAHGLKTCANVEDWPSRERFAFGRPLNGGGKAAHQELVAMRTMTGPRITTNRTGKMHTIIGTASLAGRL